MACRSTTLPALRTTLLVAGALVLASCDRNNNDDDNDGGLLDDNPDAVLVAPPQTDVRGINVQVRDQAGVKLEDVTILVLNDEANGNLVDDGLETRIVQSGTTRIAVANAAEVAIVRLEAEKEGFFSNGARYELQPGEDLNASIVLTAVTADEPGIRVAGIEGDLSTGSLTANAVAQDDPQNTLTSVTIPQDLEILDVDGNMLDEDLRVSVVHFDSRDEQALTAFPGGFAVSVENIMDIDTPAIDGSIPSESTEEQTPDVTFQSVGFTAVEIFDSQGRKADTFNGAVQVTMAIPAGAENPNTGNDIVAGDIVPVWSFDTDTAEWEYEGKEAVQRAPNGGLQVVYSADHLSYWNLDFYSDNNCTAGLNVTVFGSDNQPVDDTPIVVTVLGAGENNTGFRSSATSNSGPVELENVSADLRLAVRFTSVSPDVNVTSVSLNGSSYNGGEIDFCGNGTPSFSVVTDTPSEELLDVLTVSYSATVNARCSNATDTPELPVASAYATFESDDGATFLSGRTNAQGSVSLTGQGNVNGTVTASYNGQQSAQGVDGSQGNLDFVFDTECAIVTGADGQ